MVLGIILILWALTCFSEIKINEDGQEVILGFLPLICFNIMICSFTLTVTDFLGRMCCHFKKSISNIIITIN